MSEDCLVVALDDTRLELLPDEVERGLIDNLVFDTEQRIWPEDAGCLRMKELRGRFRLINPAPQTVGQIIEERILGNCVALVERTEIRLIGGVGIRP
ncbi:MAG: hypothetical protein EAZ36_05940 [Verrucomicrobia bacterium]|nr:MAG: hypothetical protein EAZ36_05940 [Verrucomicrobiota bacterium]